MKPMIFVAVAALLLGTGCRKTVTVTMVVVDEKTAVKTAKQAAQDAFGLLSAELAAAIEDGGTASALAVCSEKAPEIIAGMSEERGIVMERRSDRPRNAARMAEAVDLQVMEEFRALQAEGGAMVPDVRQDSFSMEVRLPIVINNPLCLKCHGTGDEVAEETREALRALYPDDRATGYQLNDLRGIWRIRIPPERKR